ncbi:hypothetical protein KAR91_02155 [Candidatus Pacearchaeota archaeon]|nr:hypothetical protein [Candidatus Pacearchaeota archaeon]
MTKIEIENKLLQIGGKVWEKENMKRIYLNIDSIVKLSEVNYTDSQLKKASKGKAYFNTVNGEFYAENGMVTRNVLRAYFDVSINKI